MSDGFAMVTDLLDTLGRGLHTLLAPGVFFRHKALVLLFKAVGNLQFVQHPSLPIIVSISYYTRVLTSI